MHVDSLRRRARVAAPTFWIAVLLVVCCSGAALAASSSAKPLKLGGTWSGKYSGAFSGTFKLRWSQTGSRLKGTITLSYPRGTYGISGSVNGAGIKFGAVSVGAKYKGKASLLSMSGTWSSPQGGGSWSAHRLMTKVKSK